MINFADRLLSAVETKRNPLCVGLDPRLDLVSQVMPGGSGWTTLEHAAKGVEQFCKKVIDAVAPIAPVLKPQFAFFEMFGVEGVRVLHEVILYASKAGLIVIGDGKRNDIGSTSEAYATAYLGSVSVGAAEFMPFPVDALTVNAYTGSDGMKPFIEAAAKSGKGLFVLCKTSNPSAGEIQDLQAGDSRIYERIADLIGAWGSGLVGESGYSSVGAVVGATYPAVAAELRRRLPSTPFLVPGFGAQGGAAAELKPVFDSRGFGAVVNSSRGVIFAYTQEPYKSRFGRNWQKAVEQAAQDSADLLAVAAGMK